MFSKQVDYSLTIAFSGPKSSRDFRETGPRTSECTSGSLQAMRYHGNKVAYLSCN